MSEQKKHNIGDSILCRICGSEMIVTKFMRKYGDYRCKVCHCKQICEWAKKKRARIRASIKRLEPIDRFWQKVKKTEICWEWTGETYPEGYGRFSVGGKHYRAHRWIYEQLHGNATGKNVCHHCDNRLCVRDEHLFIGTQKENIKDCIDKGRFTLGEKNGQARLTINQVFEIRELGKRGIKSPVIASQYQMSEGHIRKILEGRAWNRAALEAARKGTT